MGESWAWLVQEALRKSADRAIAEKAASRVIEWIWRERESFAPVSLRAALRTRVRLMAHSLMRARGRRHATNAVWLREGGSSTVASPEVELGAKVLEEALHAAITALPEQRRRAFELVKMEGRSYAEAAEVMAVAPKTVKNHMAAAMKSEPMRAFYAILKGGGDGGV